jgi:hypothetical protein
MLNINTLIIASVVVGVHLYKNRMSVNKRKIEKSTKDNVRYVNFRK